MKYVEYYTSPLGALRIIEENNALTHLSLIGKNGPLAGFPEDAAQQKSTPLLNLAKTQLEEYFHGTRQRFDLPLRPSGTPFQQKVWEALCTIPYGETRSYKEIAIQIQNPNGCRAVGMANNRNPIIIVVPCHRVIGSDGTLVGYAGGLQVKEWLLEHEKKRWHYGA